MLYVAMAVATTFNLLCAGTEETSRLGNQNQKLYEATYRINLDTKKWCDGDCKEAKAFSQVTDTRLILDQRQVETPDRKEIAGHVINRQTGEEFMLFTTGRGADIFILKRTGQCKKMPFTGFPKFDTKF